MPANRVPLLSCEQGCSRCKWQQTRSFKPYQFSTLTKVGRTAAHICQLRQQHSCLVQVFQTVAAQGSFLLASLEPRVPVRPNSAHSARLPVATCSTSRKGSTAGLTRSKTDARSSTPTARIHEERAGNFRTSAVLKKLDTAETAHAELMGSMQKKNYRRTG